jgi:hypothetical protein
MERDRRLARSDLRRKGGPLGQCSRASLLVDLPRNEMSLLIEMIVDLSVRSVAGRRPLLARCDNAVKTVDVTMPL